MLKKIPQVLSPDLLKILMEMGHGDELVLADGNFPSASIAQNLVRADGLMIPELLEAILTLYPLDSYSEKQVSLMQVADGDEYIPEIWEEYSQLLENSGENFSIEKIERFAFYERSKKAYAVVATGEKSLYANIILKKGVVK